MSRYIDADELERKYMSADYMDNDTAYDVIAELDTAPSIDLADYVPKDFHDKTCEAMAKAHQEEILELTADRPQGEWEIVGKNHPYKRCPFCKRVRAFTDTRFCDWCGARMKGADDE